MELDNKRDLRVDYLVIIVVRVVKKPKANPCSIKNLVTKNKIRKQGRLNSKTVKTSMQIMIYSVT